MNTTLQSRIIIRNDTTENWNSKNPILLKGEMGYDSQGILKVGDGVNKWANLLAFNPGMVISSDRKPSSIDANNIEIGALWINKTPNPIEIFVLASKDDSAGQWQRLVTVEGIDGANIMKSTDYAKSAGAGKATGYVDKALVANKLATPRTIALTGDISGSQTFDGSGNMSIATSISASGVVAGTYPKVTVNAKGVVSKGELLIATDIPMLPTSKITGLGTVATKNTGTTSGTVPILGADGKLDTAILPQLAIVEVVEASSDAEMLTKIVQQGDVCLRSDAPAGMFILAGTDPKVLSNWKRVPTPVDAVISINGKVGVVVLNSDNIAEGTNLYYTQDRFNSAFTAKSTSDLKEGTNQYFTTKRVIDMLSDLSNIFILDGGNA